MDNPFSDEHKNHCAEAISDALQELICREDGESDAYEALCYAIDTWVDYHSKELGKWETLQDLVKHAL